jgi:hypothetical protein
VEGEVAAGDDPGPLRHVVVARGGGGGAFDGGSGMRTRDDPLEPGAELVGGGGCYRVVRVEPALNPQASGMSGRRESSDAWAPSKLTGGQARRYQTGFRCSHPL